MNLKPARLLLALITAVSLPAMAQNVAVVNGKAIPAARADLFVKQAAAQGQPDNPQLRAAIKERLIDHEILTQEAEKQGLAKDAEVKNRLDLARQQIMVGALVNSFIKKNPVKDADIKAEYDRFKASYGDKEYHARHILVEKEDDAKAIIAKLKGGAKFEDIAKAQSKDTGSAQSGGDLDWKTPATFVKPFATALAALQKGQITETPVKTEFGYHVIKLEDTRPAQIPSLEELKPQLTQRLEDQKLQAYLDDLKKKSKIQ